MMTKSQIEIAFAAPYVGAPELTPELRDRTRAVQIAGARHGKAGYYSDGDFSSDADWCYGTGREIRDLEEALDIDDGSIGDLYSDAHSAFFRDGTINPSERDTYSRNSVFTFHFGAYGDTVVSLWAQADHLEDALEAAAEWLAEHAPGHLISQQEELEALTEACAERGFTPEEIDWSDLRDEHAAAVEDAEVDTTYTESGRLRSWEWYVSEDDSAPGHDPSHAGPRHYGPARHADGTRK